MGTWGAAEWAAFGAVGALGVYVVLGITGIVQIREARKVRELQNRPYVIVDFEFKGLLVHLVIKNIGSTPARNVSIAFNKPLRVPSRTRRVGDFSIFETPIPMVAPGRVIKVWFGSGPDFFNDDASEIPLDYIATVGYTDLSGKKKYDDPPLILDLLPYKHTVVGSDDLADVAKAMKDIRQTMQRWTSHGSLKVRASDQQVADRRFERAEYRHGARHVLRSEGARGLLEWQAQRWRRRLTE